MKYIELQLSLQLFYRELRISISPFSWTLWAGKNEEYIAADIGPLHLSFDWTNQGELFGIVLHYIGKNG